MRIQGEGDEEVMKMKMNEGLTVADSPSQTHASMNAQQRETEMERTKAQVNLEENQYQRPMQTRSMVVGRKPASQLLKRVNDG
jgi:hypothetical protein